MRNLYDPWHTRLFVANKTHKGRKKQNPNLGEKSFTLPKISTSQYHHFHSLYPAGALDGVVCSCVQPCVIVQLCLCEEGWKKMRRAEKLCNGVKMLRHINDARHWKCKKKKLDSTTKHKIPLTSQTKPASHHKDSISGNCDCENVKISQFPFLINCPPNVYYI